MSVLTSLEIENFRCFEGLRVEGLTQVSLIVGANNAGKTALLEAIEAVVSQETPFLLYRASFERQEFRWQRAGADTVEIDPRHWFHGHELQEGAAFRLRATGERVFSVGRTLEKSPSVPGGFLLTLERPEVPASLTRLPLTEDGFLGAGSPSVFTTHGLRLRPPVAFMTTARLFPSELARLWTNVVLKPAEERAVEALRLIEPEIDRIAISESGGNVLAQVRLRGAPGPVPLGSLGEGVSRLLALALHLVNAQGGFFLVDEIENGLHWSVMPKLWRFLVETARALDVQVIATTHSKDCIEGLAALHRNQPALAELVSVHRLQTGSKTSIRFDAGRIAEYVELELETR
jgi:energy-coupling factor transporter ATP-binding protein EcfA2